MLHRLPDWPTRLDNFLRARATVPFAWGANDCVTFAAHAVLAITGVDPLHDHRGKWASGSQARAYLDTSLADAAARTLALFAAQQIPIAFARRGDVGLTAGNVCGDTFCVRIADRWVGPGEDGMVTVEPPRLAWAIGWDR